MAQLSKMISKIILAPTIFAIALSQAALAENVTYYAPGPSFLKNWNSNSFYHGVCIGGEICGKNDKLTILYPNGSWVNGIAVGAHDDVGSVRKAHLQIYVNGSFAGEQDVLRNGSTLNFPIHTFVSKIEFVSVKEDHSAGGDETDILQAQSY